MKIDWMIREKTIIWQTLDSSKILMRNLIWAFETLDVIDYRTKIQIHADMIPRGKITCGTVDQAPMKKNHGTFSLRTEDSALFPSLLTSWRIN